MNPYRAGSSKGDEALYNLNLRRALFKFVKTKNKQNKDINNGGLGGGGGHIGLIVGTLINMNYYQSKVAYQYQYGHYAGKGRHPREIQQQRMCQPEYPKMLQ
jgi:hypothetical protein